MTGILDTDHYRMTLQIWVEEVTILTVDRVWTHWMKNITFHDDFHPQNCFSKSPIPQRAASLGAGVQVYELYAEADKHDAAMVGGANPVKSHYVISKLIYTNEIPKDRWRGGMVHRRRPWASNQ
jgi:hypothetical protein